MSSLETTACSRTDEQFPDFPLYYVSYLDNKKNPLKNNCVPIQFNATNAKEKSSHNPWDPPEEVVPRDLRKRTVDPSA